MWGYTEEYKVCLLSSHNTGPKDLAVLHRELYDVVNWYGLGMDLGVPYNELQKIRENHFHNNDMCRNAMLTWWFQNGWPTTWQALVNALSNSDMDRMARTIAIKYGKHLQRAVFQVK